MTRVFAISVSGLRLPSAAFDEWSPAPLHAAADSSRSAHRGAERASRGPGPRGAGGAVAGRRVWAAAMSCRRFPKVPLLRVAITPPLSGGSLQRSAPRRVDAPAARPPKAGAFATVDAAFTNPEGWFCLSGRCPSFVGTRPSASTRLT